jgi:hypothetical protein
VNRINSLHASKNGPFDLLFCAGRFFKDSEEAAASCSSLSMIIPTYILPLCPLPSTLPHNVFVLKEAGMQSISGLTVASSIGGLFDSEDLQFTRNPNFRGCDVFISDDWPKEFYHFLVKKVFIASFELIFFTIVL